MRRGLGIVAVVGLLAAVAFFAFPAFVRAGMFVVFAFDALTSSDALPVIAPMLWALWGAAIGGAIGMWMVAPSSGRATNRPMILAAPFVVMLLASALTHVW